MSPSTCKSCKAPIVWALTAKGKRIPLDASPDPRGNLIVAGERARVAPGWDPPEQWRRRESNAAATRARSVLLGPLRAHRRGILGHFPMVAGRPTGRIGPFGGVTA